MKTTKYILGLCLLGLLSVNSFATGNKAEVATNNIELNSTIQKLLNAYEIENPITGIAIVHYKIDDNGVIQILDVEANTNSTSKYVYKHLEHKKVNISEGVNIGEHTLKIKFKNIVNDSY